MGTRLLPIKEIPINSIATAIGAMKTLSRGTYGPTIYYISPIEITTGKCRAILSLQKQISIPA